jgi:hypothetical protein
MLGKQITKKINDAIRQKTTKELFKQLLGKNGIISVIVDLIKKGISPVKGFAGRFEKYSDSYKKKFGKGELKSKKKSPVNLTATGEMLNSLYIKQEGNKLFVMSKGARNNKLLDIHNTKGASRKKVIRRLLPTNQGEEFSPRINKLLLDKAKKSLTFSLLKFLPSKALKIKINTNK